MKKDPTIAAVYLSSPNKEGLVADYQAIREACQEALLFVDESYGAHFYFNESMPMPALKCGADISFGSYHKTLGTLSGSGMI